MVKASLQNFIRKYPYFLTREPSSIFYRTSDVNNRSIQRLYNDLFDVYQSFHLNKRILIWKEQSKPYDYIIHFVANYNDIKSVEIYKDDNQLIKKVEFDEDEEVNEFAWDYNAHYVQNTLKILQPYKCSECGEIYFEEDLTENCKECGNDTYTPLKILKCNECGEIYFQEENEESNDCTKNNHIGTLKPLIICKCLNCDEVFFTETIPTECPYCYEEDYTNLGVYPIKAILKEDVDAEMGDVIVNIFTGYNDLADSVLLSEDNNWETYTNPIPIRDENGDIINYNITVDNEDYQPLMEDYIKHPTKFIKEITPPLYFDDDLLKLEDNSEDYSETTTLTYDEILKDISTEEKYKIEVSQIPSTKFRMVVKTYEEYTIEKGFPENDYTLLEYNRALKNKTHSPNVYDHDYSLDELGALNNIPRKKYNIVTDTELYPYTEPPYNDKETEDDYHYMQRMLEYNLRQWYMNPVSLELWKIYGVESDLINRERYILKVFDEQMHPFDEETGLVKCWTPQQWEHKDRFCDGSKSLGEYFYVDCDNTRPISGENVKCHFNIINMLGEPVTSVDDYRIQISKIITKTDKLKDEIRRSSGEPLLFENYDIGEEFVLVDNYKKDYYIITKELLSDIIDNDTDIEEEKKAINIFNFRCFKPNGVEIGYNNKLSYEENRERNKTQIIFYVRSYENSDWFVNPSFKAYDENGVLITDYKGKGTINEPFLTMEEAFEKVTPNLNIIGLADDVHIKSPYYINKSCIILGKNNLNITPEGYEIVRPTIINDGLIKLGNKIKKSNRFFKIIGAKNCKLTLSNLNLSNNIISSYVNINTWQNTGKDSTNYEIVLIHGGGVLISVSLLNIEGLLDSSNDEEYYPYDNVTGVVRISKSDGTANIESMNVKLYYNNNLINTYTTDENGECIFKFKLNEDSNDYYNLIFMNESDIYFGTQKSISLNANKPYLDVYLKDENNELALSLSKTYIYPGEKVTLISKNHSDEEDIVSYYSNNEGLLRQLPIVDGESKLEDYIFPFGKHIIYTTYDNNSESRIRDEWCVESKIDVATLVKYMMYNDLGTTLVKDFEYDEYTGEITYDTVELTEDSTLSDFDNVLLDVKVNGEELDVDMFHAPIVMGEDTVVNYSDAIELQNAITNISFTDEGVLQCTRIGEFWKRKPCTITININEDNSQILGSIDLLDDHFPIDVYVDGVYNKTISTLQDGSFKYTPPTLTPGNHTLKFIYQGNEEYESTETEYTYIVANTIKLNINTTKTEVFVDDNFTITGTLTDDGTPLSERQIEVYDNYILLDTLTTDENGECTTTLTATQESNHLFFLKLVDEEYEILSSKLNVSYEKMNTNISINIPSAFYTNPINVSGKLTNELNNPIENALIKLIQNSNNQLIASTYTNANGDYSFSQYLNYTPSNASSLKVTYDGNNSYNPTEKSSNVTVLKTTPYIEFINLKQVYNTDESIPIRVYSYYGDVNPSRVIVELTELQNNVEVNTSTYIVTEKNSNGYFLFNIPDITGDYRIRCRFEGNSTHNSTSSEEYDINVLVTINKIVLSYVNNRLLATFSRDNVPFANMSVDGLKLILEGGINTEFIIQGYSTDNNGNLNVPLTMMPGVSGTMQMEFNNVKSNKVTFSTIGNNGINI